MRIEQFNLKGVGRKKEMEWNGEQEGITQINDGGERGVQGGGGEGEDRQNQRINNEKGRMV